jgi:transcriptional regulator with XRE-family HTH domain
MVSIYAHTHESVNSICVDGLGDMSLNDYAKRMSALVARKIISLRRARGQTQAEFARLFKVSQGSVSRWEKGSTPEPEHLAILASLAGVSIPDFLGLPSIEGIMPMGENVEVRGSVAAGVWQEAWEWPEDQRYTFTGSPNATLARAPHRFGLLVDGESMNLRYPAGTILDCVSVFALDKEPTNGQRVIVERVRLDGKVEATVKQLVIGDDGKKWLVAESNRPEFQAPIQAYNGDPMIAETRIVALVVGSYRLE